MNNFFLKGNICHTPEPGKLETFENSYLLCENGKCNGIFTKLPEKYASYPVRDTNGSLIIPGMVDLHIHAPQYAFRGLGMDCELLDWLERHAFPEETKYSDSDYAQKAYSIFASDLKKSATTRAVIFATRHSEATIQLMDLMEKTGLVSFVGKVNMDREAPEALKEENADSSAADTVRYITKAFERNYKNTYPIITPRFIPSCTDSLMEKLSEIRRKYNLPVQSHLSENLGEVELVKKLKPDALFYGDAYDSFGLFGKESNTVMAHCVHSTDAEIERMKENGVWVAHCPDSNMNVSSGVAPIRKYIDKGLRIGLGTDVAGGHTQSMFRAIVASLQVSKLYWRLIDQSVRHLSFSEAFYLATKGGGSFFGKVGSFEKGYEFDALVIDDSVRPHPQEISVSQRLERAVYLGIDLDGIKEKYIRGIKCI